MPKNMFVIIEFEDLNDAGDNTSVAIVRKSWLSPRKKDVFWPPIKNQKLFDRTLESETNNDDMNKWKIYPVARCLYETDDLEKAKKKLKLSEVTSDLLTDDQSQEPNLKRRKVVTPRRYISSDEDEESDSNNNCPPQLNKRLKNILKDAQLRGGETTPGISQEKSNYRQHTRKTQKSCGSISFQEIDTQAIVHDTDSSFAADIQTEKQAADNAAFELTGFQETVVNLLSHIKTQNSQILTLLQNKEGTSIQKFAFSFPMKTIDDIEALEEQLEDKKQVDALTSHLATIGERYISSKVSRILRHLFLDVLAAKFSFFGKRSNKRPFTELRLKIAVLDPVKKSCPASTVKDIEDSIKIWLKHAPDREKIKVKRCSEYTNHIVN